MKRANEDKTGSIEHNKKKKYEQKFLNSWLADPELKDWLEKRTNCPIASFASVSYLVRRQH